MSLRLPLLAKILSWFFLNLLALAALFYGVFHMQLRLGPELLLAGRAGERLRAVSELMVEELRARPMPEWSRVLTNYARAYRVHCFLFRNDGLQVAGEHVALPAEVADKVIVRRAGDGLGRGPPPGRGPRRGQEMLPSAAQPAFVVRSGRPQLYWIGVRLPLADVSQARPCPLVLVLASPSLRAGGLFFDPTPWLMVGGGAVVFSVLFWLPLVRSLTRALSQMTHVTEQIAEGRFEARVEVKRGDELGRLGQAINRMAARLAGFVTGQKRFLGDTAHELCSPIARMQMALGILEERATEEQKAWLADLREEVEQLADLVNDLLTFTRAGLQPRQIQLQPVLLAPLVRRVLDREAPDPERVQVRVAQDLGVMAEPELLFRALANLVRNAVRYAGGAGPITLTAEGRNGRVVITVADQGPGVAESDLERIFDPFFRSEASRSRETGGVGLGLAIVKTCVEACQGTVTARNRQPTGLEVEVVLVKAD